MTIDVKVMNELGMRIHVVPVVIVPRIQLGDVNVSDEFREEFNQWSAEWLGTKDITAVAKGQANVSDTFGVIFIREDDWPRIKKALEEKCLT